MAEKTSFVDDRYCFTKEHVDSAVSPGRVRYGRWRVPDIDMSDYDRHVITEEHLGRLDLIAYDWYKDVSLWPVIAYFNSIRNPLEDMTVGQILKIPKREEIEIADRPIVSQP